MDTQTWIVKTALIFFAFLCALTGIAYSQTPDIDRGVVPEVIEVGDTYFAMIPFDATPDALTYNLRIFNATGEEVSTNVGSQVNDSTGTYNIRKITYGSFTTAGHAILAVSHTSVNTAKLFHTKIEPAKTIHTATSYHLTTSISRTESWSVANPIIRQSSAYYDSVLVEQFNNDQGEVKKFHVEVYDQNPVDGGFERSWHYYPGTIADVSAIMARAVPDGDVARFDVAGASGVP